VTLVCFSLSPGNEKSDPRIVCKKKLECVQSVSNEEEDVSVLAMRRAFSSSR
jgi:hypothetical protein